MWFLLQLIDHEVHESNEVVGGGLGLGLGGSGGSHLSHPIFTCRPEPELTSTPSLSLQSRGVGEWGSRWGLESSSDQTPDFGLSCSTPCLVHLASPKDPLEERGLKLTSIEL